MNKLGTQLIDTEVSDIIPFFTSYINIYRAELYKHLPRGYNK